MRRRWTCSELCDHYHWWKWTAYICGRIQFYIFKFGYSRVCYPKFFQPEKIVKLKGADIYGKR